MSHSLRDKVKSLLESMTKLGIIEPVTEPTPVVSRMVVVKKDNKIRIYIDPFEINKNLKRRHYPISSLKEISTRINCSKWFTILDSEKGSGKLRSRKELQDI